MDISCIATYPHRSALVRAEDAAWRILDEWAGSHPGGREHALAVAIKLGLASMCQAMSKDQEGIPSVS